ncbi:2-hydroxyacyl-CoA lyase [Dermatophagoides pteronyssinus]|uniref:2-hydroxyacyl-CoA lyase 2 n=1 Tax=Dermatophagoides pteronyssinus TaxID=6956 RepID=A0A6P6XND0_DERPT|nr:acetolactate synthase-like protein [Dermatophagoides pteronyssinus]
MFFITTVTIFFISSLVTYVLVKLSLEGRRIFCQQINDLFDLLTDQNKMIRWFNSNINIFYHHFCKKIDPNSTRHGGELVASVLRSHGVQRVFTLSGGHVSPILTASEKSGIKVIDVRHEVNAVFAADATARISGIPGVAVVTAGPGVTNTVTAIKNAQMAESPVILLGGAAASLLKNRGALQDIDQLSLFKPITKKAFSVTKVRDIVPCLKEAFKIAQSGTPGPVFVELPIDVLYPYSIVSKEFVAASGSQSMAGKIVGWYLNNYMNNLFAGAFDKEHDVQPLPLDIPYASESEISKAVEMITKAKKPLMILGSQAVSPPIGADKLRQAVEDLGIPVYLGGMSRGLLGRNSPINMRQARREAIKECDLVILGGSVADFRLSYGRIFSRKSKIISINRNKEQLYKNTKIFWNLDLPIQADAAKFFVDVASKLKGSYKVDSKWIETLQERDRKKEAIALQMAADVPEKHLNPLDILHKLENTLDEKTILIADGGDFVGSASYILRPRGPLCWLDPGAFGTLGCGGGFALGAKLCRPDHDVVIIYGDGSLGYTLMEFDTFVRHKIPVMALVGNDACWTQIAREQVPMLGSDVACNLSYASYEKCIEGLGANGMLMDTDERTKVTELFEEAKKLSRTKPVLINAKIAKSKFREGSISV